MELLTELRGLRRTGSMPVLRIFLSPRNNLIAAAIIEHPNFVPGYFVPRSVLMHIQHARVNSIKINVAVYKSGEFSKLKAAVYLV